MSTMGWTKMPGRSIGQMKYEMPLWSGAVGSVRAIKIPYADLWPSDVHVLEPFTT